MWRVESGGKLVQVQSKICEEANCFFCSLDGSKHMICSNQKLQSSMIKRPIGAIAHTPELHQNVEKNKETLRLKS